jgi:hypothetical protein
LYNSNLLTSGFGFDAIGDCIQLPLLRNANFAASFDSGPDKERGADAERSTIWSDESNGATNSKPQMNIKSERSMLNVNSSESQ